MRYLSQTWTLKVSMPSSTPSRRGTAVVSDLLQLLSSAHALTLSPSSQSSPSVTTSGESLPLETCSATTLTSHLLRFTQLHPSLPRSALGHGQRYAAQVQRLRRGLQGDHHRHEQAGHEGHVEQLLSLSQFICEASHLFVCEALNTTAETVHDMKLRH